MADTATATTTLTYHFLDGTVADTIDVDITIPAIDTGPYSGNGFVVTGITGSLGSSTITGEVGSGGTVQHDSSGYGYDNTIFASSPNADGGSNGIDGNTDGIDGEGLEFTAAGHQYNIRTEAGAFNLTEEGVNAPAGQPLTFVSMTAPTETFTYQFLDASSGPFFVATLNVTVLLPAVDSTGYGAGYVVTGITGSVGATKITGEVGIGGTLQPDGPGADVYGYDNTIFASPGFGNGSNTDGIDLAGVEFSAGGHQYNLYAGGGTFYLEEDGVSSTRGEPVTLLSSNAPCYCPGTLILTTRGALPVQTLAIGDTVVTASGQPRPITWIGRRSYAGRFLAANPGVQPIRLRAGCLGDGLPRRDLLVSPDHALFLDGLLIPARCLVNGRTVTQECRLDRVDYYHVELDTHDVLLAEGAPSESYLDDDSRGLFHNAAGFAALYPDAPKPNGFCAPRVEHGAELEVIRRRLALVAGEIGRAA